MKEIAPPGVLVMRHIPADPEPLVAGYIKDIIRQKCITLIESKLN
jgi:hypothetical protein